jgi:probable F420-dependent oxidoreductase
MTGNRGSITREFRFGVVAGARSGEEWLEKARRIEGLGFDVLLVPDTLQYTPAPFPALAAAAAVTSRLRIGTYVLANDYRNPVMLAKEAATVDLLSGGRLELGIGAGRPAAEGDNAMLGLEFDSGAARVSRLEASLAIIKRLLAGQEVDSTGSYYSARHATIAPAPVQSSVPVLIAAGRRRLLELAAREADIVALADQPGETEARFAEQIALLREAAGERFARLTINLNLMSVAGRVPAYIRRASGDEAARQLAQSNAIPVLRGDVEEMCERLFELRERFGVSYITVSEELMDALTPVVNRLAGT